LPRLPSCFHRVLPVCLLLLVAVSPTQAERGPYRAASPEYGLSVFLYDQPATTARDLSRVQALGFGWVKALFRWVDIEHDYKGAFNWSESDRVVQSANAAGLKMVARLDFQTGWARAAYVRNGPPDDYQDFADFVYAFVERYGEGSPHGRVHAIQVWNEPNLAREWGEQAISQQSAADYVRLLSMAYHAAKGADPSVTVITAGLSPTGTADGLAQPDDQYLQWMYAAGLKGNYDVLGANANGQCDIVEADLAAACPTNPTANHPSFLFRRVEQLREIMVANGDADKQVWLMEFGWTTDPVNPAYSWFRTTEEKKAELIVQAFKYARQNWSPWMGVMVLWSVSDPAWTPIEEQYWWSITNPDGSPRPAYDRLLSARQSGELP
jgi:polysaccharide biosynthesis protein PslG